MAKTDITNLQSITLDPGKLRVLRGDRPRKAVAAAIGVGVSQVANIEQGIRKPSGEGLLRMMLLYGAGPCDVATEGKG